jgi:hypothetical protein
MVRAVLDALVLKMDGKPAGSRKRAVVYNAPDLAVEKKLLGKNRIPDVKWTAPKQNQAIDKRVVINPTHATKLLAAVEAQKIEGQPRRSAGPGLVAYFGVPYYAGLRPEEAAMLRKGRPGASRRRMGRAASIGNRADCRRGMDRHRNSGRSATAQTAGEGRVPCPPQLTVLLHEHLERFGTAYEVGCSAAWSGEIWPNPRRLAFGARFVSIERALKLPTEFETANRPQTLRDGQ